MNQHVNMILFNLHLRNDFRAVVISEKYHTHMDLGGNTFMDVKRKQTAVVS